MRDVDDVVSANWVLLFLIFARYLLCFVVIVVCVCVCLCYFFFFFFSVLFKFSIITTCMFHYVFSYDGDYGCWLGVENVLFETMTRKVLWCSRRYWTVLSSSLVVLFFRSSAVAQFWLTRGQRENRKALSFRTCDVVLIVFYLRQKW